MSPGTHAQPVEESWAGTPLDRARVALDGNNRTTSGGEVGRHTLGQIPSGCRGDQPPSQWRRGGPAHPWTDPEWMSPGTTAQPVEERWAGTPLDRSRVDVAGNNRPTSGGEAGPVGRIVRFIKADSA